MEALEAAAAASGKASATKAVARSTTTLLVKNLPYRWGPGRWGPPYRQAGLATCRPATTRARIHDAETAQAAVLLSPL